MKFDIFKFLRGGEKTKHAAKERLRLVLVHDRAELSPALLGQLKDELFNVLSKYLELDDQDLEVSLTSIDGEGGLSPALVANIPVKKVKKQPKAGAAK